MPVLSVNQVMVFYLTTFLASPPCPSVFIVPVTLTLLPVGRGNSVFEGGDGSLQVCVEVVSGTVSGEITVGITTLNGTAQGIKDKTPTLWL